MFHSWSNLNDVTHVSMKYPSDNSLLCVQISFTSEQFNINNNYSIWFGGQYIRYISYYGLIRESVRDIDSNWLVPPVRPGLEKYKFQYGHLVWIYTLLKRKIIGVYFRNKIVKKINLMTNYYSVCIVCLLSNI